MKIIILHSFKHFSLVLLVLIFYLCLKNLLNTFAFVIFMYTFIKFKQTVCDPLSLVFFFAPSLFTPHHNKNKPHIFRFVYQVALSTCFVRSSPPPVYIIFAFQCAPIVVIVPCRCVCLYRVGRVLIDSRKETTVAYYIHQTNPPSPNSQSISLVASVCTI